MPLMMATALFLPVGILIYGWTAHYKVFWIVPDIGVLIFAVGESLPHILDKLGICGECA